MSDPPINRHAPTYPPPSSAAAVAAAGAAANGVTPIGSWPSAHAALDSFPSATSTPQLVELLKHPLCVGESRRVVLDVLGWRYGRRFDDSWDFVAFAERQKLGLDFASGPQRPDAAR